MIGDSELGTLTIRLERAATPISGVVVSAGEETPFTGWLELAALLEAAREGRAPRRSADPSPDACR